MAADVLLVLPLVRQLVETVVAPTGRIALELASFRAMHNCVLMLQGMKFSGSVTEDGCRRLQAAQRNHLAAFILAYGAQEVKPKHHFALHLPAQLLRDRQVLDCFALERKHRCTKMHATECDKLSNFELLVGARILDDTLKHDSSFEDRLLGLPALSAEVAASMGVARALVARSMRVQGKTIAIDDVAVLQPDVAVFVAACVQADGELRVLAKPCALTMTETYSQVWTIDDRIIWFLPSDFPGWTTPSFWTIDGNSLTTLA